MNKIETLGWKLSGEINQNISGHSMCLLPKNKKFVIFGGNFKNLKLIRSK
jgi:hypothetical protein